MTTRNQFYVGYEEESKAFMYHNLGLLARVIMWIGVMEFIKIGYGLVMDGSAVIQFLKS